MDLLNSFLAVGSTLGVTAAAACVVDGGWLRAGGSLLIRPLSLSPPIEPKPPLAAGRPPRPEREGAAIATSPPWPPPPRFGSPHQPTTPPKRARPRRLPFHAVSVRPRRSAVSSASAASSPQQPPALGDGDDANRPTGVPVPEPFSRDAAIALPRPLTSADLMGQARGKASGVPGRHGSAERGWKGRCYYQGSLKSEARSR
ncbi:formin-like protein 5 [Triticum dicoccoides]|uniref:formin-like protein 5 n=1 Tax=Triticum dicoccoides TaxID=85692 RepID=UPI00188E8443|nr:formin-like protein 5 [Triticum dicoccoides]